ncbi:MAG: hypothetical protein U0797_21875 [Gemmataceae bacterium]
MRLCRDNSVSMWSKKPTPVRTAERPEPSRSSDRPMPCRWARWMRAVRGMASPSGDEADDGRV